MSSAKVQTLSENTATATFADGLAFIERTRRQLDRFHEFPDASALAIAPEDEAEIRRMCDALEADINKSLSMD